MRNNGQNGWQKRFATGWTPDSQKEHPPSAFEKISAGIPEAQWMKSPELRAWVKQNFKKRFVPEELLLQLGIDSNSIPLDGRGLHE